ncbi:hypothetical protein LCGC14_1423240 [marine sediment metagenome]|uniref:Uncharacterized protein n=1 Tax=marine sediment metagenome TaxID=412755 RepID=A0A0F9JR89_9ZZZZ
MGTDNRQHTWWHTCPICGKRYCYTNFMRRYVLDGKVLSFYSMVMSPYSRYKAEQTDTHQIACKRKHKNPRSNNTEGMK